ncbi:hypothetical protein HK102_004433 [Quaeritorhiza haematococci]|nr:hypothetical protein HK102_004433 [Quaeritorhiza haematococci]
MDVNGEPCCKACHDKIKVTRPNLIAPTGGSVVGPTAGGKGGAAVGGGGKNGAGANGSNEAISKFSQRLNDSKFEAFKCDACKKSAFSGEGGIELGDGRFFHVGCFVCQSCKKGIESKYVLEEGKAYHQQCAPVTVQKNKAPTCMGCKKPIQSAFIKFEKDMYHPNCFSCTKCHKAIGTNPFAEGSDGPVCESCIQSKRKAPTTTTTASNAARPGSASTPKGGTITITGGLQPTQKSSQGAAQQEVQEKTVVQGSESSQGGRSEWTPGWTYDYKTGLKELRGPGGVKLGDNSALKALGGTTTCPACMKSIYPQDQTPGPLATNWHR